jgi:DNA polymerase III epsilon subunit-like protein
VNGLSAEQIRQSGRPEAAAAVELDRFLSRFWGATLHAYNVEFDRWFLEREPWKIPVASWGECVMAAAKGAMDLGKNPRLATAARYFGVGPSGAHRALADARTAARVHQAILDRRAKEESDDEVKHLMEDGL